MHTANFYLNNIIILISEWQLLSYSTRRDEYTYSQYDPNATHPTARIWYDIVMKRRPTFYVVAYMMPCFIVMEVSLIGRVYFNFDHEIQIGSGLFTKSTDAGLRSEKVTMGLTSLLSLAVLLLMISTDLPKTSQGLPLLGIHLGYCNYFHLLL